MADEFDIHNPGVNRLLIKKLTKNFQLSRQKTLKILSFFDDKAKINKEKSISFFVTFEKDHVVIKCNKLAQLCDTHTKKLLKDTSKSLQSDIEVTSSQEEEEEEEEDFISKDIKKPCVKKGCRGFLFDKYFWPVYPKRAGKKKGKEDAMLLFCNPKKTKDRDIELILKAVKNYASSRTVQEGVGIRDAIRFLRPSRGETKALWKEWIDPEEPEEINSRGGDLQ